MCTARRLDVTLERARRDSTTMKTTRWNGAPAWRTQIEALARGMAKLPVLVASLLVALCLGCGSAASDQADQTRTDGLAGITSADLNCPIHQLFLPGDGSRVLAVQECDSSTAAEAWQLPSDIGTDAVSLFVSGSRMPAGLLPSNTIVNAAMSADGSRVALANGTLWEIVDGKTLGGGAWLSSSTMSGAPSAVALDGIRLLPDGKRALLAGTDGELRFGTSLVDMVALLAGSAGDFTASPHHDLDVSADGKRFVFASDRAAYDRSKLPSQGWSTTGARIYLADLPVAGVQRPSTWVSVDVATEEQTSVGPVAIDGAGKTFVMAPAPRTRLGVEIDPDSPVEVRDAATGAILKTLGGPVSAAEVGIARDGARAYAAGAFDDGFHGIRVWNTATGALVFEEDHATRAAFSVDGRSIAIATAPMVKRPDGNYVWRIVVRRLPL